jgi:hypothetical protein
MRTPANSGCLFLEGHEAATESTACMKTFSPQRRDRHGPVSPKPDARTWPDRPKKRKSLLPASSGADSAVDRQHQQQEIDTMKGILASL